MIKPGHLKKRPEFLCLAQKGDKWVSETVIVQALPSETNQIRFGYTATKKLGNAVIRNRAKRRMRAAVEEITRENFLRSSDIVLIARPEIITCDWNNLIKNLTWCLKRLNIIQPE